MVMIVYSIHRLDIRIDEYRFMLIHTALKRSTQHCVRNHDIDRTYLPFLSKYTKEERSRLATSLLRSSLHQ
jgi:hypothetical protein